MNKRKIYLLSIQIFLSILTILIGLWILIRYEYISQLFCIDNLIGFLPIGFVLLFIVSMQFVIWKKWDKKKLSIHISVLVMACCSLAFLPISITNNWWVDYGEQMTTEDQPDLSFYQPFEGEKVATLGEPSTLTLSEDLPLLDGAIALYPLYSAFAQATYSKDRYDCQVEMTNTLKAYERISRGEIDINFCAGPSKEQIEYAKKENSNLVFTPIGKEAFVFLVAKSNPIDQLTYQQIKNIYSGKTGNWATIGWKKGGQIFAFQRPEGSGSQTGIRNILKDIPLAKPLPLPSRDFIGTNSLMKQMSITYKGVQPALGYSYKYYATEMYKNEDTKLLKVDGVYPSSENITNGSYPFVANFYAITNGEPTGNVKLLIDWILSPQGQELVFKTGYAPIHA